jgi:PAS domain S-box-containing protein
VIDASRSVDGPRPQPVEAERGRGVPAGSLAPAAIEQLTAAALESISEGFIVLDRDWRLVFLNPAAEEFIRQPRAELVGRSLWDLFPEASSRRFGVEYRRAVAENVPVHFEEFYPGHLNAWYEVRAYPSAQGLSIFFRDITERRRTEEALRQSEERYRSLFDRMDQGFALLEVVYDESGGSLESRFLDVNPAFETMLGLRRGDVIGKLGKDMFPVDHVEWQQAYRSVVETGQPVAVSYSSPGNHRHYDVMAFRPAPRQFAVIFSDVTERKALEDALRINLTKYSVLFDSLPLGVSVTDSAGNVREINRVAAGVLGTSPDAIVGQRIGKPEWQVIRPDGSPMPPEEFASVRCMKERCRVENVESGIVRPGEDVLWINASAAPIPLEGYGTVITYGDISARRRAEDALAEARREAEAASASLEAVMDALPTGVAFVDFDGRLVRSNASFDRIWSGCRLRTDSVPDYRRHKVRWLDTGREVLPEEWASSRALRDGATVVGQSFEVERCDGGRTYVLNSAAPIHGSDGKIIGCAVAIMDITPRVVAQQALAASEAEVRRANDDLQAANRALRQYSDTLEVRVDERTNELTRRTAQLQGLAVELTRAEDRERQRVAEVIHDHLQQLLSVARINLAMAIDGVTAELVQKNLADVDALLVESLEVTRSLAAELSPAILRRSGLAAAFRWLGRWYQGRYGLNVAVDIEAEAEPDEETRAIVFNGVRELLFNVVKHARAAKAGIRLNRTADGRAVIIVSDDGLGFDPETLRAQDGNAPGFGLFSLRERLEILGGQVEVSSSPGRGTAITIVGPPPKPGPAEAPGPPAEAPLKIAVRRRTVGRPGRTPRRKKP